jgi:hypothetical protein
MKSRVLRTLAFAMLVSGLSSPALAQQPAVNPMPAPDSVNVKDAIDRAKGWANAFIELEKESSTTRKGVGGGGEKKTKSLNNGKAALFVGGQLDTAAASGFRSTGIMGTARVAFLAHDKVAPFVNFGAGVVTCCESTDFATEFGGGLDYMLTPKLAFRAGIAFRQVYFEGETFGSTAFRFGVAIPLGVQ